MQSNYTGMYYIIFSHELEFMRVTQNNLRHIEKKLNQCFYRSGDNSGRGSAQVSRLKQYLDVVCQMQLIAVSQIQHLVHVQHAAEVISPRQV